MVWPPFRAKMVTCHVPPLPSWPEPSYVPLPFSDRFTTVRMAGIPMSGIAGMKNVTVTLASETAAPAGSASFTRNTLLPLCGGSGSEVSSAVPCGTFIAAAAPAPGGGGTNEPRAAWSSLSESMRKLADVMICSPASSPFKTITSSPGDVPKKNLREVKQQPKQVIYLIDRPGSVQSMVIAGHVAPPKANPDEIAIDALNWVLGGSFISRINMNIREDKHWSYGASSFVVEASGQRPFVVFTSVQSDKTKETLAEIAKEVRGPIGARPLTAVELAQAQSGLTLALPGSWETARAVGGSIAELVRFGLPDDYFATYAKKVRALGVADEATAAAKLLHPDNMVWVVVGDRSKIEGPIRELGWGDLKLLDADGNPL
ncbi:MAG: insulinase family protein [Acidobacteriia bacterium]|nr:insulinase family protein [Terriglobia bacterium]